MPTNIRVQPPDAMGTRSWRVAAMARATCALALAFGAAGSSGAADASASYPSMAPLAKYLMTSEPDEIALARSAAPPSISNDAEVMALDERGFRTVVKGTNGFVCLVQRSW